MALKTQVGKNLFNWKKEDIEEVVINSLSNDNIHFILDDYSYNITLVKIDLDQKTVLLKVNDQLKTIHIQDELDQRIQKMGLNKQASQKLTDFKAPMPGLILDILVKPDQSIQKGDKLLVLEAMKMENLLQAPGEGIIKSINFKVGDKVEKGQVIIEMV